MAAIKRYNNVQLDGKPMKIEMVGTNISTPGGGLPPAGPHSAGAFGDSDIPPRRCVSCLCQGSSIWCFQANLSGI